MRDGDERRGRPRPTTTWSSPRSARSTENSDDGDHHTPAQLDDGHPRRRWDLWRRIAAKDPVIRATGGLRRRHPEDEVGISDRHHARSPGSRSTSKRYASATRSAGRWSRAASSTARDSKLVDELDSQPAAALQAATQGPDRRLGLRAVRRRRPATTSTSRCRNAPARRSPRSGSTTSAFPSSEIPELAADRREDRAGDDALRHLLLHASSRRGPAGGCPGRRCQLRVPRPVRGDHARHDLHHRVLGAHRDGGRLPAARYRTGRPGGFDSTYDVRKLLAATARLRDGEEMHLPGPGFVRRRLVDRLDHTEIGQLLEEFGLLSRDG